MAIMMRIIALGSLLSISIQHLSLFGATDICEGLAGTFYAKGKEGSLVGLP
jgi:hypothetical protein